MWTSVHKCQTQYYLSLLLCSVWILPDTMFTVLSRCLVLRLLPPRVWFTYARYRGARCGFCCFAATLRFVTLRFRCTATARPDACRFDLPLPFIPAAAFAATTGVAGAITCRAGCHSAFVAAGSCVTRRTAAYRPASHTWFDCRTTTPVSA
jgi:hypothetical protein